MSKSERAAPWRSLMYVPANVRRFVDKAPQAGADAVILDLEDSVPPAAKETARETLAESVGIVRQGPSQVLVRVNRPLSQAVRDVEAAVAAGADGIVLTKAMGPEHVVLVAEMLDLLAPLPAGGRGVVLVPIIETAAAVAQIGAIAAASPRVAGLLCGAEDLAAELGCAPDDETVATIKRQMVVGCAAAGVAPLGLLGTVADFRDPEAVRAVALASRRAGFTGATCVHPAIVPVLNAAFAPTAAEVDLARRQIEAAEMAAREGRGSFAVDGRMVDEPILRRARRVLAQVR
ncbi:CoA ester lyase [Rhodoplanes sp. TEM]|uniref:CoA ester lyase n=1 Tax=Rhodoplanes tepidamans TaxID=200616 RepID=A0ABT5J6B3_RHOTP|nr:MULTISPECIES: CoA ester lyase [Rhodoplanes]MDC7785156.1 CoA ester lyase [Rhodoplanes tepidamans]MDC7982630.1 CoA ester lyase [Rhodoplanes sp. TEM]MDQ0356648.1 citrate lyase subunit beta/citryl-CoA lyase [Rhodoplanes tepidamans]